MAVFDRVGRHIFIVNILVPIVLGGHASLPCLRNYTRPDKILAAYNYNIDFISFLGYFGPAKQDSWCFRLRNHPAHASLSGEASRVWRMHENSFQEHFLEKSGFYILFRDPPVPDYTPLPCWFYFSSSRGAVLLLTSPAFTSSPCNQSITLCSASSYVCFV